MLYTLPSFQDLKLLFNTLRFSMAFLSSLGTTGIGKFFHVIFMFSLDSAVFFFYYLLTQVDIAIHVRKSREGFNCDKQQFIERSNKVAGRFSARAQRWWKMGTGTQWAAKSDGGILRSQRGDRNTPGASTRSQTGTQRVYEDLTMRGVLADLK